MWALGVKTRLVLAGTACVALGVPAVHADPPGCRRINSLPAIIDTPGVHCLSGNLATGISSGSAISINANDVVLDLGGFALEGTAGAASEANGVRAIGRSQVTVRNGIVRGFFEGIVLVGSAAQGGVVEDIAAEGNLLTGIAVEGQGAIVRRSRVVHTGGSASPLANGNALGIAIRGTGSRALDNDVVDTFAAAGHNAWSIHATNADRAVIERNRVSGGSSNLGTSYGIIVPFSQDVLVVDNRVNGTSVGVAYSSGATGKYRDNLTSGVGVPYDGSGTDAGNNQ